MRKMRRRKRIFMLFMWHGSIFCGGVEKCSGTASGAVLWQERGINPGPD